MSSAREIAESLRGRRRGTGWLASCPVANHGQGRGDKNPSLSIDDVDGRVLVRCHGGCANEDVIEALKGRGLWESGRAYTHYTPRVSRPKPVEVSSGKLLPDHVTWLAERGISLKTAEEAGVGSATRYIRGEGETSCLTFPYTADGVTHAVKFRSPAKGFSCEGSPKTMWRIGSATGDELIIVEGEMDALALMEAGLEGVVSVPNGAGAGAFEYIWESRSVLESMRRVTIAVDNDGPGQELAEELSRRIGRAKCFKVVWAGGKDANEVLINLGAGSLRSQLADARPWPVAGLTGVGDYLDAIRDIYERGFSSGLSTGYESVDEIYTIKPGELTIVTGVPGSGKSEFVDQLAVNLALDHGWKFAVCSFENYPPSGHVIKLAEKKSHMPFHGDGRMAYADLQSTLEWVGDHFYFLTHADGATATIDGILERAEAAVLREGVNGLVIDPYNYIERAGASETDDVSDMLTAVRSFAQARDVHVWFVAHPRKLYPMENGDYPVPKGNDISGSMAWWAKADCGLTVAREGDDYATIHIWKVRQKHVGKVGKARLRYDITTGSYSQSR